MPVKPPQERVELSRETILQMTGPRLAEAVAEHVMLWRREYKAEVVERLGSTWADAKGDWHHVPYGDHSEQDKSLFAIVAPVWEPWKDIRSAFAIVDGMAVRGWHFDASNAGGEWAVGFRLDHEARTVSDSLPLAICRAALLSAIAPSPMEQRLEDGNAEP